MFKAIITAGIIALSSLSIAHADDAKKCKVEYMATLNGGAALRPTTLTIRNDGQVVLTMKASSGIIKTLDCGKLYVASVTTEVKPGVKVTRTRTMMLVSSAKLIVAMDN